uniref:efflux RND transporter periplasmic adaptor subunit n=1 Tax=Castellaniella defragrans TaxID=75697 RepID=UPI0033415B16
MAFLQTPSGRMMWPVLFALAFALSACGKKPEEEQKQPPLPVSAIQIQPAPTTVYTELPGRVQAIEDAEIRARVTGIVQGIEFEQGSRVKAGQLLFMIDPAPYQAARNQAAAQLQSAQATAKSAKLLAQRYARLIKEHAISQQDYDNAVAQADQSAAAVAAAKAALESAEIDLGYTRITSPIDGIIGKSLVTVGALVSASSATQMATVQRLDQVYVDITQSTNEIFTMRRQIADGILTPDANGDTPAQVLFDSGNLYQQDGKLLFSGITVDPGTSQVSLRALFPNPDELLLPGMYVRVRLAQGTDAQALVVPAQAIQRGGDGSSNLVLIKDGKAVITPVSVGPRYNDGYIISRGLAAGDQVVVEGFQKIRPGAPVQAMPWAAQGQGAAPDAQAQPPAQDGARQDKDAAG